jgi:photosystem II stability/assembly factor-like uncharacterized protein
MKQFTVLLLFITHIAFSQQANWKSIVPKTDASFRGLSVVDDSIAWLGGSKGWIGRTISGGNDWTFTQVKGFEKYDFRSIYAFNAQTAIIANAGAPASIFRTDDGGQTWTLVYKNNDTAAFIDAVDFWNKKEGIIYGDPLSGHMFLLKTNDGGKTWHELPKSGRPALSKGEASFAASGTCMRCIGDNKIVIVTGGTDARIFISKDKCKTWSSFHSPIVHGQASTGIFSVAFHNNDTFIVVGGDYKNEKENKDNAYFHFDGEHPTWRVPMVSTRGYRECVEYISNTTALAAGPTGTDISYDYGITWKPLSDETGFHVVRKSRKGKLVILAGSNGKISLLNFPKSTKK